MTIAERLQALYSNFVISLNFINEGIQQKADKPILATASSNTLLIGKVYNLGVIDGDTITLSDTGAVTNECPYWHFFFEAGSDAPLWAQTIDWASEPTFTEGTTYEVSILKVGSTYNGVVSEKEAAS